jgi:reverse gyrase
MTEPQACARCGGEIPAERLEAIPDTRVCVKCAQAMGGSDFTTVVVAEKTSKEGSLKKNYGSYHTKKIPKPIPRIGE